MARNKKRKSMRDAVREKAKNRESGFSESYLKLPKEMPFFKPKKGNMRLDFLPFELTKNAPELGLEAGDLFYTRSFSVHKGIGANDNTYLCLKQFNKRCPICDQQKAMRDSGNYDEDIIKALYPKDRELYQLIDLDDPDKGVQLWDVSYHLFGKLLLEEIENDEEYAGFAELEDGFTVNVRFKEKKFGAATYHDASKIDFEEREENYDDSILDDVIALDGDIFKTLDYETLEIIFLELDEEVDPSKRTKNDDEEEELPSRTRKAKKKPEPEEEEEEPPFDPEEEEEEEEEKPEPKSRGRKAKKEPEPEEEEEEEEEPEEKPARTRRERKKKGEDDNPCPCGFKFGIDLDAHDDCADCPEDTWNACADKNEEG